MQVRIAWPVKGVWVQNSFLLPQKPGTEENPNGFFRFPLGNKCGSLSVGRSPRILSAKSKKLVKVPMGAPFFI